MTAREPRFREQPKQLDAGVFQAEISSFALRLAAEGKAAKTIRTYTEAVAWFAAAHLIPRTRCISWEQVTSRDVQRWMAWLLDRYSSAYVSNQYRALQQFFRWLAAEDQLPDPMAGLRPPHVAAKLVPVFTPGELSRLEQACAGRSFTQRRDTAIIAVFTATGIRLSKLAGLRSGDVDLWQREITVRGKGGKDRIVKIGHQAARSLDRYVRARSRHAQACAAVARGRQPGAADRRRHLPDDRQSRPPVRRGRLPAPVPAPLQPHLAGPRRPEGDLMELNGWTSPQMLRRYGASARSARARRTYDRIMTDT